MKKQIFNRKNKGVIFLYKYFLFFLLFSIPIFSFADIFETTNYADFVDEFWNISIYFGSLFSIFLIIIGGIIYSFSGYSNEKNIFGKGLVEGGIGSIFLLFLTKIFYTNMIKIIPLG